MVSEQQLLMKGCGCAGSTMPSSVIVISRLKLVTKSLTLTLSLTVRHCYGVSTVVIRGS